MSGNGENLSLNIPYRSVNDVCACAVHNNSSEFSKICFVSVTASYFQINSKIINYLLEKGFFFCKIY